MTVAQAFEGALMIGVLRVIIRDAREILTQCPDEGIMRSHLRSSAVNFLGEAEE